MNKDNCLQNIFNCGLPTEIYTVDFTINNNDIEEGNIQSYIDKTNDFDKNFKKNYLDANTDLSNFLTGFDYKLPCRLSKDNNGGFLLMIYYIFIKFGISPRRMCNMTINIISESINIEYTISPSNSSDNRRNDILSPKCIGEWMITYFNQWDKNNPKTDIDVFVKNTEVNIKTNCGKIETTSSAKSVPTQPTPTQSTTPAAQSGSTITGSTFTSSVEYEKFSQIKHNQNKNNFNIGIENYQASGYIGPIQTKPISIFDYIFQYAYVVSFIGSILYVILSSLQLEVPSILINRNLQLFFNLYIGLCGFLSFCTWFKIPLKMIDTSMFNMSVIKIVN